MIIQYLDSAFCEATIEWLVAIDQVQLVLQIWHFPLTNLDTAAYPCNGTSDIPKNAQDRFLCPQQDQATWLYKYSWTYHQKIQDQSALAQNKAVSMWCSYCVQYSANLRMNKNIQGQISLTCDARQASNTDGYFAITRSWIEEGTPHVWTLWMGILAFIQLNNSHNSIHLGQALYKAVQCQDVTHKVHNVALYLFTFPNHTDYIRLDTSPVTTLPTITWWWQNLPVSSHLKLANHLTGQNDNYGKIIDLPSTYFKQWIHSCMAHIINLATQTFLTPCSSSKHYDPATPEADIVVSNNGEDQDAISLIHATYLCQGKHVHMDLSFTDPTDHVLAGMLLGAMQRTVQEHSDALSTLAAYTWYESTMLSNVCNAQSCVGTERGKCIHLCMFGINTY